VIVKDRFRYKCGRQNYKLKINIVAVFILRIIIHKSILNLKKYKYSNKLISEWNLGKWQRHYYIKVNMRLVYERKYCNIGKEKLRF